MHELAETGGAAHAAYKGGLDALQANSLQAWTRTLRALPPALSSLDVQPHEWSNQAAAAAQLFRCELDHPASDTWHTACIVKSCVTLHASATSL